ncbi:LAME_0G03180g1_1 [Lachancea meyersii CBS 8951]|uniref:LAME_0G03180g1_1 n=1 Tax=Lachancea meyersii CBS 8951 TaxID=1266667 RepID=A0A1G4K6K1_9SACH|nr:LAME_0G03180g1_1 [Lachancea meyersii CBS 8951]
MSSRHIPNVLVLSVDQTTEKLQPKRLRVPRACDACRARKVRCDGRQPCIHCTVYSHDCTYSPISRQAKKPRVCSETLEAGPEPSIPAKRLSPKVQKQDLGDRSYRQLFHILFPNLDGKVDASSVDRLIELIERSKFQGLLNIESIEAEFLEQNSEGESGIEGTKSYIPDAVELEGKEGSLAIRPVEMKIVLPPLDMAKTLIFKSWRCACVLFRFNHRPTLLMVLESLYETAPEDYTNDQNNALPLIYSILAVGALFTKDDFSRDKAIQDFFHQEGYKYFTAARKLIDITNVSDVCAIQTIFMMTIFLQCSAKLTTCYSLIGIALRAALRIGLHKKSSLLNCSLIEAEVKKRLFWTIYKMDVYVNIIMGLPVTIADSDIDQELPANFHDDDMTENGIVLNPWSYQISSCGLSNEHTKLIRITKRIYDEVRSHKKNEPSKSPPSKEAVCALEKDLIQWQSSLPPQLKADYEFVDQDEIKAYRLANYFLNFDFLHASIMLYRPFIDTVVVSTDLLACKTVELELAIKCLRTAQQVIAVAGKMCGQKILCGSYWFSVHTLFLAATCLMYTVHQVQLKEHRALSDTTLMEVQRDLKTGIVLLHELRNCSITSERTFNVLNKLFEKFNDQNVDGSVDKFSNLSLGGRPEIKTADRSSQQNSTSTVYSGSSHEGTGPDMTSNGENSAVSDKESVLDNENTAVDPTLVEPSSRVRLAPFFEDSYLTGMLEDWDALFETG